MKKILSIVLIVLISLGLLGILKDQIVRFAVEVGAKNVLGADVSVGGLSLGILNQRVVIKNLKVYNPPGFKKDILVSIPKIDVSYDLASLLKKKLHLPNVAVNLDEMSIVKNKEGKLNVDSLKVAQAQDKAKSKPKEEAMPMQIDNLELSIGRVIVRDYQPEKPLIQVYEVNMQKKVYKNLTSAQQMASIIMVTAMGPTAIKSAAIYSAASIAGVAFLPLGAALFFTSADSVTADLNQSQPKLFEKSMGVLKELGEIGNFSLEKGFIEANLNGIGVKLQLAKIDNSKTKITISARKFAMPKPEVANGVLYEIKKK